MFPRILIDLKKIEENTKIIADNCKKYDVDILGVTKSFCAIKEIAEAEMKGGVTMFADARIENLAKLKDLNMPKMLLRLPMQSKVEEVVKYADISLNSEIETIKLLSEAAIKQGKVHKVVLMNDLGDLREGVLPQDVPNIVEEILKLDGVELYGVGVNLTCYGGIIPDEVNLGKLCDIAEKIREEYSVDLKIVSGGNSSSYYLLEEEKLPKGINNLRMGEILVLGRETAFGKPVHGMYEDAFIFEAEIIELKEKASVPTGTIGMDAFGNTPTFDDRGKRKRAILGVGRQDVDPDNLVPLDEDIDTLGASSDHLIMDVTDSKNDYKVGDIIRFKVDYGSLLTLMTSEYISKEFK